MQITNAMLVISIDEHFHMHAHCFINSDCDRITDWDTYTNTHMSEDYRPICELLTKELIANANDTLLCSGEDDFIPIGLHKIIARITIEKKYDGDINRVEHIDGYIIANNCGIDY